MREHHTLRAAGGARSENQRSERLCRYACRQKSNTLVFDLFVRQFENLIKRPKFRRQSFFSQAPCERQMLLLKLLAQDNSHRFAGARKVYYFFERTFRIDRNATG